MRSASVGWLESVISDNKEMLGKTRNRLHLRILHLIIIDANIYATIGVGIADDTHRIIRVMFGVYGYM